jgi:ABC-2 type transport system permease protein
MLGIDPILIGVHAVTVVVLALGLSGLSVGLGAWMPNFRESDPSKIAVGFGGTLNLITGLLFLLAVVGLMAAPWHLQMAAVDNLRSKPVSDWWLILGVLGGIAIGVAAVLIPLHSGARALRQMEF